MTGFLITLVLAAMQFVPLEFVHPVRVQKFRPFTLFLVALWSVFAVRFTMNELVATPIDKIVLGLTGAYFFFIGPVLQFIRKA
jgi:phosphatidylcholine synthase